MFETIIKNMKKKLKYYIFLKNILLSTIVYYCILLKVFLLSSISGVIIVNKYLNKKNQLKH